MLHGVLRVIPAPHDQAELTVNPRWTLVDGLDDDIGEALVGARTASGAPRNAFALRRKSSDSIGRPESVWRSAKFDSAMGLKAMQRSKSLAPSGRNPVGERSSSVGFAQTSQPRGFRTASLHQRMKLESSVDSPRPFFGRSESLGDGSRRGRKHSVAILELSRNRTSSISSIHEDKYVDFEELYSVRDVREDVDQKAEDRVKRNSSIFGGLFL